MQAMRVFDLLVQNGWIKESAGDVLNKDGAGTDSVKHEQVGPLQSLQSLQTSPDFFGNGKVTHNKNTR